MLIEEHAFMIDLVVSPSWRWQRVAALIVLVLCGGALEWSTRSAWHPAPSLSAVCTSAPAPPPSQHLIVPFQVAMLTNGSLQLPADTADVYIEIGANSRNLLIDELPLDAFPSAFLLTFEPLMHKWAKIMSRETRADSSQRTGFYHARAMAFPIAIHDSGAVQTFNVAPMDGCSSLLPGNPAFKEEKDGKLVGPPDNNYDPFVAHACLDATEQRQVPTVSLEVVIRDWLRDEHDIAHVKIDAQGYDIQAFKTAGRSMHRIKRALFEVWADRCRPLYVGQLQCRAVLGDMRALGYTVAHGDTDEGFCAAVDVQPNNNCEKDVVFDRAPGPIT